MKTNSEESNCPKCGEPIPADAPQQLCPKCVLVNAETLAAGETLPKGKAPAPTLEELTPHFPDLEILELIGSGGMGAVYKARQLNLDRFVALKVLSHDLASDPAFAERFGREARVLAKLSHPNIVGVYDSGIKGPYFYLLMEYVDGVNLRQAMRTGGFSPAETLTLVEEVCSALKFAHGKSILHRDIKPENVLIDADGQVKIADFGIAKIVGLEEQKDVTLTYTGSILGSPQYMAPEQIESPGDVDQRADIYSLGVVLYEMLTGELPLGRFALPSEKVSLDARIDDIVLRTLEKEREARFQSADEVRTSVEAVRTSPGVPSRPTSASVSDAGTARFATLSATCAGISLMIAIIGMLTYRYVNEYLGEGRGAVLAVFWAGIVLGVGIPAILGTRFGAKALEEIRPSDGAKRGFGRALFGTLGLPTLLIITAIFGLYGNVEWFWSPPAGGTVESTQATHPAEALVAEPGGDPETASYQIMEGEPRVDLNLSVAPGLVITYELVQTDAVGKEFVGGAHQGFILTSDKTAWQGSIQLATTEYQPNTPESPGWRTMLSSIRSNSDHMEYLGGDDDHAKTFTFAPEWTWRKTDSLELALSEPGQHVFEVATRSDASKTLSLRIRVRPRAVPGVPAAVLDQVALEQAVCGVGGDIDWIRYLMEAAEKQIEVAGVSGPVREPEPEWQNGHPEKHCNFTVPAGMVATFKLEGANDEIHQQGYIVASDLEPWEGKLRIGSLASNSVVHMRLEGPYNTITATLEKPDTWQLEPDAYTQTLDNTKTTYFTYLGRVRVDNPSDADPEFLKLVLKVERRKYQAAKEGLPEVLAFHHMALGKAPDWIFGLKQVFEMTDQPQAGRSR